MLKNLQRGTLNTPVRAVIYGPEGIGKSTFASEFPEPIFIDTEGSTERMEVDRIPVSNWVDLVNTIDEIIREDHHYQTLVIDTADEAERFAIISICHGSHKNSIADFGFGAGYTMLAELYKDLINRLDYLRSKKHMNIVFTAHSQVKMYQEPGAESYDRYELKLEKKTSPLLKEWCDLLMFCNYDTRVFKSTGKKNQATDKGRVMYVNHSPYQDAKNRFGLVDGTPFEFSNIKQIIPFREVVAIKTPEDQQAEFDQACYDAVAKLEECQTMDQLKQFWPRIDKTIQKHIIKAKDQIKDRILAAQTPKPEPTKTPEAETKTPAPKSEIKTETTKDSKGAK